MVNWFVYIIKASDELLYTGITTDVARRWKEHSGKVSTRGAKFFRGRLPAELCFVRKVENRSQASKLEASIKKLSRATKLSYIASSENQIIDYKEFQELKNTND